MFINPSHYGLERDANEGTIERMLEQICERDLKRLQEAALVSSPASRLECTEFGDAMARYYVRFETMKNFLALDRQADLASILQCVARAEEFKDIRLKSGEKSLYKTFNKTAGIRFPIDVDVALPAHKVSLLLQAELGGVDYPSEEQLQKHRIQYIQDRALIFQHVQRLVRCLIDCMIHKEDAVSVRHGLELVRGFAVRAWDDLPSQLRQIDQIGWVAVRKLAAAGITSIYALASTEARRIEMILSRQPPFGSKILAKAKQFPNLKVTAKVIGKHGKAGDPVSVRIRAEIVEFGRLSARKLGLAEHIDFVAPLYNASQYISFYAMCEEIG
ncbi:MAG: Sec63 [Phylliscum demangeonii]|nr:MAG: Sec63 [Phylliscum demangeonii]